jgi:glycosyltransferase involved in cell wall biosynthesis
MSTPTVSALVIARDEERHIQGCLESLAWTDERIVVVDEASTDATESIARRHADLVLVHPFTSFAAQRNRALDAATSDWVLALDADERATPSLASEIRSAIACPRSPHLGYRIPIRSRILGRPFKASGTQLDRPLRLFHRLSGHWEGDVHETVTIAGSIGNLRSRIDHCTLETMQVFLRKIDFYTTLEARRLHQLGRKPRPFDLTLRPFATFLRLYLARAGFLDGPEGFLFCALSAASLAARNWKLRELHQNRPAPASSTASRRSAAEVAA